MKYFRRLILLAAAMVFFQAPAQAQVRLAVAADLHYIPGTLTNDSPLFEKAAEKGDARYMAGIEEITDAFIAQILQDRPDALILSGDLTFNGAEESHLALREKLRSVAEAGIPVLALPGNHDLNSQGAFRYEEDGYTPVNSVSDLRFQEIYGPLALGLVGEKDPNSLSAVFDFGESLRVLLVDVNTPLSPGWLTEETYWWIEEQLVKAKAEGKTLLPVSHQTILSHGASPMAGYKIYGASALEELYVLNGCPWNLCGHIHTQHLDRNEGFQEIATAALSVYPCQYGLVVWNGNSLAYEARPVKGGFREAAQDYFIQHSYRRALAQAQGAGASAERAEEMASSYAAVNLVRFAGEPVDRAMAEQALSLWEESAPSASITYFLNELMETHSLDSNHVVLAGE